MTKREYLISLGLAKAGRGRFSREAQAALAKAEQAGMTFDDPAPTAKPHPKPAKPESKTPGLSPAVASLLPGAKAVTSEGAEAPSQHKAGVSYNPEPPVTVPEVKPQEIVRNVKSLNGYTKEGWKVNFATCAKCANHVKFCKCSGGPHAPSIVVTLDEDSPAQVG